MWPCKVAIAKIHCIHFLPTRRRNNKWSLVMSWKTSLHAVWSLQASNSPASWWTGHQCYTRAALGLWGQNDCWTYAPVDKRCKFYSSSQWCMLFSQHSPELCRIVWPFAMNMNESAEVITPVNQWKQRCLLANLTLVCSDKKHSHQIAGARLAKIPFHCRSVSCVDLCCINGAI